MTEKIAMQIYCVACGMEQYAPSVWAISNGEGYCSWCGAKGKKMTEAEYRKALDTMRKTENMRE